MTNRRSLLFGIVSIAIFLPFCVNASTPCSTAAPCAASTEYCDDATSGICQPVDYDTPVVSPSPIATNAPTTGFSAIFVSDAQFDFTNCKTAPLEQCIFNSLTPAHTQGPIALYGSDTKGNRKKSLSDAADRQYDCVEELTSVDSAIQYIFDGGDLTNIGDSGEYSKLVPYHSDLASLKPLIFNLGNHDYGYLNSRYTMAASHLMVTYLLDKIGSIPNVLSFDFKKATSVVDEGLQTTTNRYTGSLSYSIQINDYVIVMLHWAACIPSPGTLTRTITGTDSSGVGEYFDIVPMTVWLETQLAAATAASKKIVLFPHSRRGLERFIALTSPTDTGTYPTMSDFLGAQNIVAVLSGHDHDAWGLQTTPLTLGSGASAFNVPVIFGGSLSYQTLTKLSFLANGGGVSGVPYDTSASASCAPDSPSDA